MSETPGYVHDAIDLLRDNEKVVGNDKLKKIIEAKTGFKIVSKTSDFLSLVKGDRWIRWHIVDRRLKDDPLTMSPPHAILPFGGAWYLDPTPHIMFGWVQDTLSRHRREIERCCAVIRLPKYRGAKGSPEVLRALEDLRDNLDSAIEVIKHNNASAGGQNNRKTQEYQEAS